MGMPLAHLLLDPRTSDTPESRRYREIEKHYHVEMIADNTQELVAFGAESLRQQARHAQRQSVANNSLIKGQSIANGHLAAIAHGLESLGSAIESGFERLDESMGELEDAVRYQTEALLEGFEAIAQKMIAQHETLLKIAETLRRPYETQMLELREQADKWLTSGMGNIGQARLDDFADASQLLGEVVKNPIGNQDYVTWFQIGWLKWKYEKNIGDAEQAFYRASRLSAPKPNRYYIISLRHQAYMQYLQGRHEDAYQTVHRTIGNQFDRTAPFDAARYAAKTGRNEEALQLLEQCIDIQPTTIVTMFAEEDFFK